MGDWIRPLVIVFLPVILFEVFFNRKKIRDGISLIGSMLVIVLSIAYFTYRLVGIPAFQSSTSGVNLIQTANDRAYGGVATQLLSDSTSTCFIKNAQSLTFVQKDSVWTARAVDWIKAHPLSYAKLYGLKIAGLFMEDSWADRPILGGAGTVGKKVDEKGLFSIDFLLTVWTRISKSIVYYAVCIMFLLSIRKYRKRILQSWRKEGLLIAFLLMGIASTCLFSVSPRYHYPFMFVIVVFAAEWLHSRLRVRP